MKFKDKWFKVERRYVRIEYTSLPGQVARLYVHQGDAETSTTVSPKQARALAKELRRLAKQYDRKRGC